MSSIPTRPLAMTTLYIDRRDAMLELRDGQLRLELPADEAQPARSQRVPLALLERIVAVSRTTVDTSTLAGLAEAGISLVALGGRRGDRVAWLEGAFHNEARIRIGQALAFADPAHRLRLAQLIVAGKLREQRRFLGHLLQTRPDLRKPVFDALATLGQTRAGLRAADSLAAVRGLEGATAAAYFRACFAAFPPSLAPEGRRRRPPPDPVNAVLSLCYTLGTGHAVRAARVAGLDPAVGFLHAPAHARAALALDLLETERPAIDRFVWRLFAERTLEASHFGRDGSGACLLGKAGRGHLYGHWATTGAALEKRLTRRARRLARHLVQFAPPPETEPIDEADIDLSAEQPTGDPA
ncbi:MAG: CRISPR-associated endonuclease Cas1 [Casimicrobiaceae bacterium]